LADQRTQSGDYPCSTVSDPRGRSKHFLRGMADARVLFLFVFAIIALSLGTVGFYKYFSRLGEAKSLATAFYDALWLFTIEAGNLAEPIPWQLEIARWLSPVISMYAVLLGLAVLFRDQARLLGLSFLRNHVILCGLGQKGLNIARSFRENGYPVVIIEKDGNNPNIASCREFGALVLTGDARDAYLLKKAGITKARYLVGVCGEDGVNADLAVIARKLVENRRSGKLSCTIHIQDMKLWVLLRTQEFRIGSNDAFRLDIFNIYDQGAKQLFRQFPITKELSEESETPDLLIIGVGDFAEQVVLNAARRWSPMYEATQRRILISVVDPEAEHFIGRLCQEHSLVDQVCQWEALVFDTGSIDFLRAEFLFGSDEQPRASLVYVMVEEENVGLSSALQLVEKLNPFGCCILVRMNEEKGLANLIRESSRSTTVFNHLFLFGLMERTCKLDLIYNSSHEAISRAIHEEYLRQEAAKGHLPGSSPVLVDWDCLPEGYKEMNRSQADSIGEKLRAINCDIAPWSDYGGDKFTFNEDEIEMMAEMEHERWCDQKKAQGWVYGETRDERLKLHPSLVPYDDLRLSESEKDKDRNTVKEIPHFLALAGYQIYRV